MKTLQQQLISVFAKKILAGEAVASHLLPTDLKALIQQTAQIIMVQKAAPFEDHVKLHFPKLYAALLEVEIDAFEMWNVYRMFKMIRKSSQDWQCYPVRKIFQKLDTRAFSAEENMLMELIHGKVIMDAQGHTQEPFLQLAAAHGFTALVWSLVKAGIDIDAVDRYGQTALHKAAMFGQLATAKLLIKHGATVDIFDSSAIVDIHHFHSSHVKSLPETVSHRTPLHYAAYWNHPALIEFLLDNGAQVNAVNAQGASALHFAAYRDNLAAANQLIQAGANVSSSIINMSNSATMHELLYNAKLMQRTSHTVPTLSWSRRYKSEAANKVGSAVENYPKLKF